MAKKTVKKPKNKSKCYGYVIKDEPQFCVWGTRKEAEEAIAEIGGTRVSEIFEFEEPKTPEEAFSLADTVLDAYVSLGY